MTVIVGVGDGVVVEVAREEVAYGVRAYVNQGLIVEGGVRVIPSVGVVVAVDMGDIVRLSVGMMEVLFGSAVPVLLGLGILEVLVGVGVVLDGCVAVTVGLWDSLGDFGVGVEELVAK